MLPGGKKMLTPLDLKEKTFSKGFRGYDAEEVNQFLRQIAREYERLYKDNEDLKEAVTQANKKMNTT